MSDRADRQDLHAWSDAYVAEHPDDVLVVDEPVDRDQEVTALVTELWSSGRAPLIWCRDVRDAGGAGVQILTNAFASRPRVARMLGAEPEGLHAAFVRGLAARMPPVVVDGGPILDDVREEGADVADLPMLVHFEQDAAPYLTSAIVLAEDPATGVGNLSYHRCMVDSPGTLATSLHSRGHLWRYLAASAELRRPLPVAVILGGHPLFMLAAAARVAMEVDERDVAGGLFGEPLEVVRTPRHGLGVPASSDIVLEGVIDATRHAAEGPFGEYSGYASARSTNNVIEVQTVMRRRDAMMLDVVSGNAADHLNLGRIPRESELVAKIRERFPDVAAVEYPVSGTHFHCYVAIRPGGPPEVARQVLLAILGMDPYVKLAVAVDDDVDVRRDEDVLWAIATRFQADRDVVVVPRLPGSMLDPSSDAGVTARMALDATRGQGFEGERISLSDRALVRARELLDRQ